MLEFEIYNPNTRMSEYIYGNDDRTVIEENGFDPRYWHIVNVFEVPDPEEIS